MALRNSVRCRRSPELFLRLTIQKMDRNVLLDLDTEQGRAFADDLAAFPALALGAKVRHVRWTPDRDRQGGLFPRITPYITNAKILEFRPQGGVYLDTGFFNAIRCLTKVHTLILHGCRFINWNMTTSLISHFPQLRSIQGLECPPRSVPEDRLHGFYLVGSCPAALDELHISTSYERADPRILPWIAMTPQVKVTSFRWSLPNNFQFLTEILEQFGEKLKFLEINLGMYSLLLYYHHHRQSFFRSSTRKMIDDNRAYSDPLYDYDMHGINLRHNSNLTNLKITNIAPHPVFGLDNLNSQYDLASRALATVASKPLRTIILQYVLLQEEHNFPWWLLATAMVAFPHAQLSVSIRIIDRGGRVVGYGQPAYRAFRDHFVAQMKGLWPSRASFDYDVRSFHCHACFVLTRMHHNAAWSSVAWPPTGSSTDPA